MTDYMLNDEVKEMLTTLETALTKLGIDFYLVGAVARDIRLSVNPAFKATRKTKDVDIAIFTATEEQFYTIKEELLATGHFTAHETQAIKLFYKHKIELDLLPFGEIENESRETKIHQPRLFIMDMPGFMEAFPAAEKIQIIQGTSLKVCSLEGLVLLKLIAYSDNAQRTKDLSDIDHIISVYFDLNSDLIYESHMQVMDQYDVANPIYLQLISARIIGMKIKELLANSAPLQQRLLEIAGRRPLETWAALAEGLETKTASIGIGSSQ